MTAAGTACADGEQGGVCAVGAALTLNLRLCASHCVGGGEGSADLGRCRLMRDGVASAAPSGGAPATLTLGSEATARSTRGPGELARTRPRCHAERCHSENASRRARVGVQPLASERALCGAH